VTSPHGPKYVYGLADPEDGKIRYVGASKHPEVRYAQHLALIGPPPRDFQGWLKGLQSRGLLPDLRILSPLREDWPEEERRLQDEHGATLMDRTGRQRHWQSSEEIREQIASNLLMARSAKGMNRSEAAVALSTTPTTIYRWENADRAPGIDDLVRAGSVYGVGAYALLPEEGVVPSEHWNKEKGKADARKARRKRN
jgi:DNA-binding XRE family transcriptional regulator